MNRPFSDRHAHFSSPYVPERFQIMVSGLRHDRQASATNGDEDPTRIVANLGE